MARDTRIRLSGRTEYIHWRPSLHGWARIELRDAGGNLLLCDAAGVVPCEAASLPWGEEVLLPAGHYDLEATAEVGGCAAPRIEIDWELKELGYYYEIPYPGNPGAAAAFEVELEPVCEMVAGECVAAVAELPLGAPGFLVASLLASGVVCGGRFASSGRRT